MARSRSRSPRDRDRDRDRRRDRSRSPASPSPTAPRSEAERERDREEESRKRLEAWKAKQVKATESHHDKKESSASDKDDATRKRLEAWKAKRAAQAGGGSAQGVTSSSTSSDSYQPPKLSFGEQAVAAQKAYEAELVAKQRAAELAQAMAIGATARNAFSPHMMPATQQPQRMAGFSQPWPAGMPTPQTACEEEPDPLDAYMNEVVEVQATVDMHQAIKKTEHEKAEAQKKFNKMGEAAFFKEIEAVAPEGNLENSDKMHCYICKQWGHTKKDCPNSRCRECGEVGHRQADCKLWQEKFEIVKAKEKEKKRQQAYEAKRQKKRAEKEEQMRRETGLIGYKALYRVLELPDWKLASESQIKRQYHILSLKYHPDKNPDDEEAANKFMEVKTAYDLLVEGMKSGGEGMGGAVFMAGELTDSIAKNARKMAESIGARAGIVPAQPPE